MPVALGRVAGETVKEMVQLFSLEKPTQVETEEEVEEKISNIDLSQSCLNDDEKTQFRSGEIEARKVISQAESMSIEEPGVLCKVSRTNYKGENPISRFKYRMVIPATLVRRVLSLLHEDVFAGGHVGVNALQAKIIDKFYWGRMQSDILSYVRACERCSLRKRAPKYKAEAKSLDTPSRPWQVVQCDFIGPLKKASNGARHIMTFIDLLTGWPEAFSTKDSMAKTAAEVFLYQIVCRYGRVERLHTDRGATFLSDLFREITSRVACKQTFTAGGMPTGNARVERMHKTLETIIGCYVTNGHENWPDLVPIALWTIRSTTSVRTGFSPFSDLEGDLVYMYDPTAAENMASKFSNVYRGPYRVVDVRGDYLVRISSLATGKEVPHYVNLQKIKRAYGPWSPVLTKARTKPTPTNK